MFEVKKFVENNEGVHLCAALNAEYTICGDAFDIGVVEKGIENMVNTKKRIVTCQRCISEIKNCRRVRIN